MIVLSVSALKPSQYRKFVKGWDKGRYADLFAKYASDEKAYRFSLPLIQGSQPVKTVKVKPLKPVSDALEAAGYVVDDYIDGYAVDAATGKRRMKIGKIIRDTEIRDVFNNDKRRASAKQKSKSMAVIVSRHPYDIAGMSTGRGWTSCMNLEGGSNRRFVPADIAKGSIIAYLVEANDLNITRPKARILMRVYKAKAGAGSGKMGIYPASIYGTAPIEFYETVKRWCSEVNRDYFGVPYGATMKIIKGLYGDGVNEFTATPDTGNFLEDALALIRAVKYPDSITDHWIAKNLTHPLLLMSNPTRPMSPSPAQLKKIALSKIKNLSDLVLALMTEPMDAKVSDALKMEIGSSFISSISNSYRGNRLPAVCQALKGKPKMALAQVMEFRLRNNMAAIQKKRYAKIIGNGANIHECLVLLNTASPMTKSSPYKIDEALRYVEYCINARVPGMHGGRQLLGAPKSIAALVSHPSLSDSVKSYILKTKGAEDPNLELAAIYGKFASGNMTTEEFDSIFAKDPDKVEALMDMAASKEIGVGVPRSVGEHLELLNTSREEARTYVESILKPKMLEQAFLTLANLYQKHSRVYARIAAFVERSQYGAREFADKILELMEDDLSLVFGNLADEAVRRVATLDSLGITATDNDADFHNILDTPVGEYYTKQKNQILSRMVSDRETSKKLVANANKVESPVLLPAYSESSLRALGDLHQPHLQVVLPLVVGSYKFQSEDGLYTQGGRQYVARQAPELAMADTVAESEYVNYFDFDTLPKSLYGWMVSTPTAWEDNAQSIKAYIEELPKKLGGILEKQNSIALFEKAVRINIRSKRNDNNGDETLLLEALMEDVRWCTNAGDAEKLVPLLLHMEKNPTFA